MKMLALYFEQDELVGVRFNDGTSPYTRISTRGKTAGPSRACGSFQWTAAVKAFAVLAVKTRSTPENALLMGTSNSLAASLDYAISKQPLWLSEMFGCDHTGTSLLRRMILRTNPERKRPGPVILGINQMYFSPTSIVIFEGNKPCIGQDLSRLCERLENLASCALSDAA